MKKFSRDLKKFFQEFQKPIFISLLKKSKNKSIILILLFASIVRLATVSKLLPFTPDEEYLIYLAQTIIKNFHIIWIGVSSLGFDLYMGPFWIYIISPFLMLSKGDPLVLGYLAGILGVLTTFLLYWFGQKLLNKKYASCTKLHFHLKYEPYQISKN